MCLVIDFWAPLTGRLPAKTETQKGVFLVAAVHGALIARVIAAKAARFHDGRGAAGVERRRRPGMGEVQDMSKLMSKVVRVDRPACSRISATTSARTKTCTGAGTRHIKLLVTAHNLG